MRTLLALSLMLLIALAAPGDALALSQPFTGRIISFITPAFRDCYISMFVPVQGAVYTYIVVPSGGDIYGISTWSPVYGRYNGVKGVDASGTIWGGYPVQLAFSKGNNLPGVFAGNIWIYDSGANSQSVPIIASGYCESDTDKIPFPIMNGQSF